MVLLLFLCNPFYPFYFTGTKAITAHAITMTIAHSINSFLSVFTTDLSRLKQPVLTANKTIGHCLPPAHTI